MSGLRALGALVALLALHWQLPQALAGNTSFAMQTAGVRIITPSGYGSKRINMAMADFGKPLYGATLVGRLVYPSESRDLNPNNLDYRCKEKCEYACQPLTEASPPFNVTKKPGEALVFLVDRGPRTAQPPCFFLRKVYNAMVAGADAVLVANDEPGDLSVAVIPDDPVAAEVLSKVTISAAMISQEDGKTLKSLLAGNPKGVTVGLNWTDLLPRAKKVDFELWTNTNDECGPLCDEQRAFIKAMKPWARALQQSGNLTFTPHYMIWSCPEDSRNSTECMSDCIMNGTYCAPDPDGSISQGYRGQDVLARNVEQLCFARLAAVAEVPWLWWDYADSFATNCSTKTGNYTSACAHQVFGMVGGPLLVNSQGTKLWEDCIASGSPPVGGVTSPNQTLALLERELTAQMGNDTWDPVTIMPTIRINGQQYRGGLDVASVMRALCAAFPLNSEPPVCNEKWVSGDDECQPGGPGYAECHVGDPIAAGRNRCTNTFAGYRCDCGQGWVRSTKPTGEEVCEDLNECVATNIRLTNPACSCDRCACVNTPGSYNCTGPLPDMCTKEHDYGGCWRSSGIKSFHACVDTIEDYKRIAAKGTLQPSDKWYTCKCPGCFEPLQATVLTQLTCTPKCPAERCILPQGLCIPPQTPSKTKGGAGAGSMFLSLLLGAGLTAAGLYAVYHFVLKQRMSQEIRDIMAQYMPLDERGNRRGGGGAGRDEESAPLLASPGRGGSRGGFGGSQAMGYVSPAEVPAAEGFVSHTTTSATASALSPGASAGGALGRGAAKGPWGPVEGAGAGAGSRQAASGAGAPAAATPAAAAPAAPAPAAASQQAPLLPVDDEPLLGDGPL